MLTDPIATAWSTLARHALLLCEVLFPLGLIFTFILFEARSKELTRLANKEREKQAVPSDPVERQPIPDAQFTGYGTAWLRTWAADIGGEARAYFVSSQFRLDVAFPLIYGLLFASALAGTWEIVRARYATPEQPRLVMYWLLLLPALAAGFDLAENFTVIHLLKHFENWSDGLANAAGWFTRLKWLFLVLSVIVSAVGGVWAWRVKS